MLQQAEVQNVSPHAFPHKQVVMESPGGVIPCDRERNYFVCGDLYHVNIKQASAFCPDLPHKQYSNISFCFVTRN